MNRSAYNKNQSLTRLIGEYKNPTGKSSRTKFTYHSYLRLDRKSREHGMSALRLYANNNRNAIKTACIKCNKTDEILETIIEDPNN